jgi:hypothetical protein
MPADSPTIQPLSERFNFYLSPELRDRLRRAAAVRQTTEGMTLRWLLERSLQWFESLPPPEQQAL